jgi:F0F1-type ATP synthase membrane subunit b/b'
MGRKPELSAEEQRLKDLIRQAHEAVQALRDAIRDALALAPVLIAEFEAHHHNEMAMLSNHMTAEGNRAAADLNAAVDAGRTEILRQLAVTEAVLDKEGNTVRLLFNSGRFNDQVPPPFPNHQTQEKQQ